MKSPLNQFDKVTFAYDALANLVIGDSIRDSQRHFLSAIESANSILVVGGGTGWILVDIRKINSNATIFYVEASSKMIAKAREQSVIDNVTFLHGTEEDIPDIVKFDAVITNFYFDLFAASSLKQKIETLKKHLLPGATWLATDFQKTKNVIQQLELWAMYRFFTITAGIEASILPPWQSTLQACGMNILHTQTFKRGFILAIHAKKSEV